MTQKDTPFADLSADEEAALLPDDMREAPAEASAEATAKQVDTQDVAAEPAAEPQRKAEDQENAEAEAEPKADKPPEGYVPHGALHAERERRKQYEAELADLREWRKQVEQKLNPPKPEPEMPDPVTEPDKFRDWQKDQLRQRDERFAAYERQLREQTELQQTIRQQMMQRATHDEQAFRAQTPDYDDAINHLGRVRLQELELFGVDPQRAQQIIAEEARGIVQGALQMGRNVAEVAYGIAKARGYDPKAQQVAQPNKAAEESARLRKIADASRSVGAASGGGTSGDLTLEDVAAMSPEEIAALPEHERRRIMGG